MKLDKTKKAEMTSKTIIEIVILIIGFGIILFVYSQLAWTGTVDRETCSQSVIYRGTLFDKYGFTTKEIVPLKCKTRLVCISDKTKGDCKDELGDKYDTIKIDATKDKIDNQIKMALAREMADCWNMLGEGKVQIFSREKLSSSTKGVICSRISFDKSIKEKKGRIQGFTQYLISHQVPGQEESYWKYLTRDDAQNLFIQEGKTLAEEDSFNLNEKSILFIERDQSYFGGVLGLSGGVLLGGYAGFAIGSVVPVVGNGVGFVVGTAIAGFGGAAGGKIQDKIKGEQKFISGEFFIDYSPKAIKDFNVDSLENIV